MDNSVVGIGNGPGHIADPLGHPRRAEAGDRSGREGWRHRVGDLLDDPLIRQVMRADGMTRDGLLALLAPVARMLAARTER